MDDFLKDLDSAQRKKNLLQQFLVERESQQKSGQSVGLLNEKIRGGLSDLTVILDSLQNQVILYDKDPSKYKMAPKEIERRKALVQELEAEFNIIQDKNKEAYRASRNAPVVNIKRDKYGEETAETKNLSNQDLKSAKAQMLKDQDVVVDQLIGVSDNLLVAAQGIGDEVDLHNALLDSVDKNVDHTQAKMDRTQFRMKELIMKSSDSCLLLIVVILIVAIVLVLVLL
ncbi:unnamed protein product [Blepharisma stoltei]|uniref:t-SNARE coiled-coil homology domain-containing protein n=1 Tax=Blepharisma stoltei TaxID=1481888 RepID=A0AAU9JNR3_9CILI|nr:unnamed protein product [Blepharisma stoltei]